jgi:hemoglobin
MRKNIRRSLKNSAWLALVIALVLTSLADNAEARRRHRRAKKAKKAPVINEKVLYERIGGQKAMNEIVDEWLRLDLADSRVSSQLGSFAAKPEKLQRLRHDLGDQLCELADGPCQYKGPDMKNGYAGIKLSESDFIAFSENLFKSMQKIGLQEREKNELLGRIGYARLEGTVEKTPVLGSMEEAASRVLGVSKSEKATSKSEEAPSADESPSK